MNKIKTHNSTVVIKTFIKATTFVKCVHDKTIKIQNDIKIKR